MPEFTIQASRDKGKTFKVKATVEAPSAPKALRQYGCNVKGRNHSVVTRRGTTIKAVKA